MKRASFIFAIVCAAVVAVLVWQNSASRRSTLVHSPQIDHEKQEVLPPLSRSWKPDEPHAPSPQQMSIERPIGKDELAVDMKQLGRKLAEGDASARSEAITIAKNPSNQIELRRAAVAILGNDHTPQTLAALFDLLRDPQKSLRGAALFALPTAKRPAGYDYTSELTPESLIQLDREKTKLLIAP